MSDASLWKLGGAALVVWGLKLILFGGTKQTGTYIELFGYEFGSGEREPMGTLECWFVGLAMIAGGAYVFRHAAFG